MKLKNVLVTSLSVLALSLTGCATGSGSSYTVSSPGSYSYFQKGVVESARTVDLGDNGVGTVVGAVLGGVVGNQFGKGSGKTAATVGGAVVGGYAGNQINKDVGQELFIRLDNGNTIKQVNKGEMFRTGDYVTLEFADGKIKNISLNR